MTTSMELSRNQIAGLLKEIKQLKTSHAKYEQNKITTIQKVVKTKLDRPWTTCGKVRFYQINDNK